MAKKHHRDMTPEELKNYIQNLFTMPEETKYKIMVEKLMKGGASEDFAVLQTNLQKEYDEQHFG